MNRYFFSIKRWLGIIITCYQHDIAHKHKQQHLQVSKKIVFYLDVEGKNSHPSSTEEK